MCRIEKYKNQYQIWVGAPRKILNKNPNLYKESMGIQKIRLPDGLGNFRRAVTQKGRWLD